VRAGVLLYADACASQSVGVVTSGTFGPSAAGPVAMGYVPRALSAPNTLLFADVRGNRLPVEVMELPFVAHRYKRT
jgi:aminomethyltransferase